MSGVNLGVAFSRLSLQNGQKPFTSGFSYPGRSSFWALSAPKWEKWQVRPVSGSILTWKSTVDCEKPFLGSRNVLADSMALNSIITPVLRM